MFFFRRTDASLRNEWTNYTNWAYKDMIPQPPQHLDGFGDDLAATTLGGFKPGQNPQGTRGYWINYNWSI